MEYKDFEQKCKTIFDEVCVDKDGYSGRHRTYITVMDSDGDKYYNIKEIEPDITLGCGCWVGITIIIEEEKTDAVLAAAPKGETK